jgi:tripartite-type tricarboxylate transporter receptor subunit TctC
MVRTSFPRLIAITCLSLIGLPPVMHSAPAQENFFAGKTIRIIVGTGSGGGYDGAARLTARYLGKYIPGQSHIRGREHARRLRH